MANDTATTAPAADELDAELRGGTPAQERKLRAQGKKTMGKLVDAAMEVFGKRGYSATRVDDIVKLAKTSHGTFYLYFSNKEDLLRALLSDCVEDMRDLAVGLDGIEPGPAGVERLRDWLEQYQRLYDDYWPVIHAWAEAEAQGVDFGRMGRTVLGSFSGLFADRIRQLSPAGVDPEVAGLAFVSMIERFNYYVETRALEFDRDTVLDTLATIAHRGMFGGRP